MPCAGIRLPKFDRNVRRKNIVLLSVGLLGIVSFIIQNEVLWLGNSEARDNAPEPPAGETCIPDGGIQLVETGPSRAMKWVTSILTLVLLICVVDYYRYQLKLERQRLRAPALQLYHLKKLMGS